MAELPPSSTSVDEPPPLILASASPRRRALLAMIGVTVDVAPADLDETAVADGLPVEAAVAAVAAAKVAAVGPAPRPVLAADTEVCVDGVALGKPADRADAARLLRAMSGTTIEVRSGVAIRLVDASIHTVTAISTLVVATLDDATIRAYLATGEADDKAGALAVQGSAGAFTSIRSGSRSNVYGLPLRETCSLLDLAGIAYRHPTR